MKSPNPPDAEIGARLRVRRLALRMSQREVAAALDIGPQQIHKYESGLSGLGAGQLHHLAQLLDVNTTYFLDYDDVRPVEGEGDRKFEFPTLDESLQLCRAFATVRNAKSRKAIIDLVVSLAAALE
jgi:transcriptional regulator with XRE-family HTH domain